MSRECFVAERGGPAGQSTPSCQFSNNEGEENGVGQVGCRTSAWA